MQIFHYMVFIWEDYEKERSIGELFAHFEDWDVQAIRKESYEETLAQARKQVESEMDDFGERS